ncbi:MAG: ATP-dependent zinc metalloprotease FtsH [Gammaproteobacteria bacterium]|nr:ATP-dependent zinc metalloprotease FtsH [Gammaproteobacteria bacterium]
MDTKHQFSIWYVLVAIVFILMLQKYTPSAHVENLAYNEFKLLLKSNKLDDITLNNETITGVLHIEDLGELLPPETINKLNRVSAGKYRFVTVRIEDPNLIEDLQSSKVRYVGKREHRWIGAVLSTVLWIGLFFGVWLFAIRRMSATSGTMSVGKSKAKVYVEQDTKVTFDDVAGVDEAKEELQEVVNFLREPKRYGRLGARIPKGILLVGPPGTGKTLFARAIAGEAKVPFFSISGSEFVEMFVGVGAARVRDLFEQARLKAPAIIFIDELDALGRARSIQGLGGGHDEKEQTLNQLLAEMDGFDPSQGVVLLAATNRPEILDAALLRAGRFDRQVLVDRPDKNGRAAILRVHIKKITLAPDFDEETVAALTPGFTGADLANLVNEAAILATRREADAITLDDFTLAIERIVAGLEKKNRILNPEERKVIAYHEMGHALVAMSLTGVDPVHKISIIPRGIGALGYTIQRPTEDRFLMTREELADKMAVLLGGRAAEFLIFKHLSTGAADDLAKATDIARSMVTRYGMDENLGHVVYQQQAPLFLDNQALSSRQHEVSDETIEKIDRSVRELIQAAFDKAKSILIEHRNVLEHGAQQLLTKETLVEEDLSSLLEELSSTAINKSEAN